MNDKNSIDPQNDFNREYIEAYVPDKIKIAKYVKLAKGPERTMAEFAEACGKVSASTFSRIANQKITKPLSTELIIEIIRHAAEPKEFSYYDLMRANGMVPKDEHEQGLYKNEEVRKSSEERENARRSIRNIISDELWDRGCNLLFYQRLPLDEIPKSGFGLRRFSNFAIRMQGYEPKYWNFIVYSYDMKEDHFVSLSGEKARFDFHIKHIMDTWSPLFLSDAWEPETLKDVKNSIVFTDSSIYDVFCDMINKIKVNTWMSVILVDIKKQNVIAETMIPRHDGQHLSSIFDEAKKTFDEDYDM